MSKPILCLDFDGVINSYESGWVAANFIPDPPVPGAMEFLLEAVKHFSVRIYSTRSHQDGGIEAMRMWLTYWARKHFSPNLEDANAIINGIVHHSDGFPKEKPPAMVTLDDRALTFTGEWPKVEDLLNFKPWYK